MAEGFLGYVLPWGQMSYWAAIVILSLFGAIPFIGPDLQIWIQGVYIGFLHYMCCSSAFDDRSSCFSYFCSHEVGAGNPEGVDIEK